MSEAVIGFGIHVPSEDQKISDSVESRFGMPGGVWVFVDSMDGYLENIGILVASGEMHNGVFLFLDSSKYSTSGLPSKINISILPPAVTKDQTEIFEMFGRIPGWMLAINEFSEPEGVHVQQECLDENCGGLCYQCTIAVCGVCGCFEGSLLSNCPGYRLDGQVQYTVARLLGRARLASHWL